MLERARAAASARKSPIRSGAVPAKLMVELAQSYFRSFLRDRFGETLACLDPVLHPLLDPKRTKVPLVWPLEAPMMAPEVFAQFSEVRIASGRHDASELTLG